jgi:hypothetical protein
MSENLPFSCFRQSEQSDMFSEQILSGFHEGVKALRLGVGKPCFSDSQQRTTGPLGVVMN